MKKLRAPALKFVRASVGSTLTAATLIGGTQVVAGSLAVAKTTPMMTTSQVNVRSGPSTSSPVIAVARSGQRVLATGAARNGWVPVRWNGRAAWISAAYLTRAISSTPVVKAPVTTSPSGTGYTTSAVNVRTAPSLSSTVVTVLQKGTRLSLTGTRSGNWLQLRLGDQTLWISRSYVSFTPATTTAPTTPVKTTKARATTDLMIRTNPGPKFQNLGDIPAGTVLMLTGRKEQGVSQIIWDGQLRWVNSLYLAPVGASSTVTAPAAPKVVGYRYATTALNIRTTPTGDGTILEVPTGTKLGITGVYSNNRAQIVFQGAVRWVTAAYLSTTPPTSRTLLSTNPGGTLNTGGSSGLDSLTPTAKGIVYAVRQNFPQISTMYGVRPDPLPDHPSGHAVDIMLPNYRSNYDLGLTIAHWMQAHAAELNIKYIIYHQHIWSVARAGEGWRAMADRGSDTANHFDHVHVTVN